jgi:hypothetical protein
MCMGVFLASSHPLPFIEWREESPGFNVSEPYAREDGVRAQFSLAHVYALGAATRCGCGFTEGQGVDQELVDRACASFAEYVTRAATLGPLELYVCWEGDWTTPPRRRVRLRGDQLTTPSAWFEEGLFATIEAGSR